MDVWVVVNGSTRASDGTAIVQGSDGAFVENAIHAAVDGAAIVQCTYAAQAVEIENAKGATLDSFAVTQRIDAALIVNSIISIFVVTTDTTADGTAVAQRTYAALVENSIISIAGATAVSAVDYAAVPQLIDFALIVNTNTCISVIINSGDDTVNRATVVQRIAAICVCILKTIYSSALWIVQQRDRDRGGVSNVDLACRQRRSDSNRQDRQSTWRS